MTFAPGPRFSSFRLTISRRLALLVGAAALLMLCGFAVQLSTIRDTLLFERRTAIRNEVQTAISIARAFAAEVAAGRLSEADAQERARMTLRSMRFGEPEVQIAATKRAESLLGFTAHITLDQGLRRMYEVIQRQHGVS